MHKETVLNWRKAERPFPKKFPVMNSDLQIDQSKAKENKTNPFGNLFPNIESPNELDSNESKSKLRIKDLCTEDKTRIANLIKELAKISEEKKQIQKSLEEERLLRETEISNILKKHEILLNEKETLLKKFSKTQQKLRLIQKIKNSNQLPPRPDQKSKPKIDEKINQAFNPFKSSTPKNLSPRSISPISNEKEKIEISISKNEENYSNEIRKLELIKEQMELAEEQKKLKTLLESQEEILREKQAQIMIQQQIHLKRLEELSALKAESHRQVAQTTANYSHQTILPYKIFSNATGINENVIQLIPQQMPIKFFRQDNTSPPITQSDSGIKLNEIDDDSLENLANIVYKKMLIKKKTEKTINYQNKYESESKKIKNSEKQEDECLIDFMIEETKSLNSISKNSNKKEIFLNQDDLEESRLIEDLFFIK